MSAIPMLDEDECYLWTGCVQKNGYGRRTIKSVTGYVHRQEWEKVHGPIPEGLTIDHLCRVKLCMNVRHMELVTVNENTRRAAVLRASGGCAFGHGPWDRTTPLGRRYCSTCTRERNAARPSRALVTA